MEYLNTNGLFRPHLMEADGRYESGHYSRQICS